MKNNFLGKKISSSFSLRLSLKFTGFVTVILILMVVIFNLLLNFFVRKQQSKELNSAIFEIENQININSDFSEDLFLNLPYYITYSVFDENSKNVIFTNDPFLPKLSSTKGKAKYYLEKDYFIDGNLHILYMSKKADLNFNENDDLSLMILTAINIDSDYASNLLRLLPKIIVPAVLIVILISFFISYSMTKNTIKPVKEITKRAKAVSIQNLEVELPVSKKDDEIDELAKTFNSLFLQIKKDFEREKQFSSDVSHELKTPLSVINGQTSLLLRWGKDNPEQLEKSLNSIKAETKSMQTIIENLLQINRYERGLIQIEKSEMPVFQFFTRLKDEFEALESEKKIEISIVCEKDLSLITDFEILHQIFSVFISNSIKFCDEKDSCKIVLKAEKSPENSVILIEEDNGAGFAKEDLPYVFDRFYIGDKSRSRKDKSSGYGLGLSIAKILCTNLGSEISAENSEFSGARIKVQF